MSGGTEGRGMAELAALLADDTRAGICVALLDGRAWTAGELARRAGVAPSTASDHLTRLVRGGLLVEERQGRHRYLRLAGPSVAQLIEDLAGHAPAPPAPAGSLRAANANGALAYARTCYDHLAGRLGVLMYDALLADGRLDRSGGLALTPDGWAWAAELGVPVHVVRTARRPVVRDCLDWTERRPHLAGALGAALCRCFVDRGWITPGAGRAVRLTPTGRTALAETLDVPEQTLAPTPSPAPASGRA
ncbi:DNA-binding transcriptional ArsR family regulator [Micromonospora luteifusca]|uniref:DNA-binding transcriptional ArsR family regulator n=1 Tax=Micromonospora luteifusca TaxID=709860 RepID=A0ABS2M4J1_9ACTN|nr:winged helix-turn-helix domain-containing protein [Micromonospora luteifusca]MBM7495259.1 DNA-binding transcriptional ArsR family regulator [Micromonospora luteifusca]